MRVALLAALGLALLPAAAGAESLRSCVEDSTGPFGCDAPLRSLFEERGLFAIPEPEEPRLPPPPSSLVPLEPRRGALAELDGDRDPVTDLRPLRRMRPRGDSVLPPVSGRPMGRDPRAVQRFQAPYRFD